MSAVVSGTKARLQNLMPGMIGTNRTFSDSYVEELIMAGFYEATERCDLLTIVRNITLTQDTLEYDLDDSFIDVVSVEFLSDGSNVDGHLYSATLDDLDRMSCKWRDDRGSRPDRYVLSGAPGTQESTLGSSDDGAKILIYRPMASVSAEIVRVHGLGIGNTSTTVPNDVQKLCLVPYVMSHLKAISEPQKAGYYRSKFLDGCEKVRGRFANQYRETI